MLKSQFEKSLDKATSHLLIELDWENALACCDSIRQGDTQPKIALALIKKKLISDNPHTVQHALMVLESMVKNCGAPLHEELTSDSFCETLHDLAKGTKHENIKFKVLELLQTWHTAFKGNSRHQSLSNLYDLMKMEGFKFPAIKENDAMFSITTAPKWSDGGHCHRCRAQFTLIQRKHHCRACGQVFCGACSSKTTTLPKLGIEKEVRVCDACYDSTNKSSTSKSSAKDTGLPSEYLNSSLSQQKQAPPRNTEDELKEEEDLQLALALSESEAEAKKQKSKQNTYTSYKETRPSEPAFNSAIKDEEEEVLNPELLKYLNRPLWESKATSNEKTRPTSPSAPSSVSSVPLQTNGTKTIKSLENGYVNNELEGFITRLRSQVEIFINRMKSNSSRGRSIANDTSVQTLFMNITAMHSKLLLYIKEHDDSRLHFERLQDKLTQVKDARAALDALREEHREKLRQEAEEAERLRQLQMAHKLEIMRKKKQEYLQYQRQLALQRVQEQEREMQIRQEQQKQQYMMGGIAPQQMMNMGFGYPQNQSAGPHMGVPYGQFHPGMMAQHQNPQTRPPLQNPQQGPFRAPMMMHDPQMMGPQQQMNHSFSGQGLSSIPPGMGQMGMQQGPLVSKQDQVSIPPNQGPQVLPNASQGMFQGPGMPMRMPQGQMMSSHQFQQPGAPPASPQVPQPQPEVKADPETAELISFD